MWLCASVLFFSILNDQEKNKTSHKHSIGMEEPCDKDPASALLLAAIDTGLFIYVHNCSMNSRLEDWEGKELPGSLCPVPCSGLL